MRKQLLAALGVAGSLLVDLPALAQLSNTTSTFSGQVAATCQINNLAENINLNYMGELNYLTSGDRSFQVTTNNPTVRIHASRMTIVSEPFHTSYIKARIITSMGYGSFVADKNTEGIDEFNTSTTEPNVATINAAVFTDLVGGKYTLPSGNYSYRVTISCLQ